ncbi:ataxin-2-like isoform X2 [Canis lupus dingo]|uniref:ataxin-2-like isoform X2 n=1 Tax=Canis lupus dingo TaxID=286419 RepID=UPI0020C1EB09|nr:ataxin-2-like isoform X2 [Canis lupus dingo]
MPRLVLLQTSGFGGGPPARRAGLAAAGGAGALPRPAPASLPPRPGPGPGTCRGARVCTSPGAGGAGEKKKKEEKSKEHPTCQRHTHLLQPRRSPAALTSAECLQKVPHGSSAPPHRPCYTCFKEEATEVLGCWVTCLRFPSGRASVKMERLRSKQ